MILRVPRGKRDENEAIALKSDLYNVLHGMASLQSISWRFCRLGHTDIL